MIKKIMAFRRRRGGFRGRRRRQASGNKMAFTVSKARGKPIRRLARRIQTHLGEKKYFTLQVNASDVSAGVISAFSLSDVTQSDTDVSRDGDQLTLTSLEMNYYIRYGSAQAAPQQVRVIVFQWFPNDLSDTPTVGGEILLSSTAPYAPLSPYDHDHRFLFRILYDRVHIIGPPNSNIGGLPVAVRRKVRIRRFPRTRIQYVAAGTTGTNKIYCTFIGDTASGASITPNYSLFSKLNYRDS